MAGSVDRTPIMWRRTRAAAGTSNPVARRARPVTTTPSTRRSTELRIHNRDGRIAQSDSLGGTRIHPKV